MTTAARQVPEGRYGTPRGRLSRPAVVALVAAGLVVGGGVTWVAYRNLGSAPIEAERATFANLPGNRMEFAFDVTRRTPEQAAVCVVRTRGIDGQEGGRKEVYVPPGSSPTRVSTVITSGTEPVTADVFGCSYQVPAYLSTQRPPSG
ncbi:DUF4307 domain-containing protein [Actinokineospora bangkokensis]|uniref:DUF4307 domain-containing protein n=1 Tax=Actinokineospora bangkokensis TaxID=1193682 RepID=A0A1Q9LDC1_9PSEU|nr:DUF4307 domain-containing protein [Actinokineospora bangkokensis]OLR90037.1 hypothetical protein BJP25_03395 [Actinokineospora bangkokensis]